MKFAKSTKFIVLISVLLLAIVMAFASLNVKTVKAEEEPEFSISSTVCKIDNDNRTIFFSKGISYAKSSITGMYGTTFVQFDSFDIDCDGYIESYNNFSFLEETESGTLTYTYTPTEGSPIDFVYTIKVGEDTKAPSYIKEFKGTSFYEGNEFNRTAFESSDIYIKLNEKIQDKIFFDKDNGIYNKTGSNSYISLPSFGSISVDGTSYSLIEDDYSSYSKLSFNIHYKSNSVDSTVNGDNVNSSSLFRIPVAEVGTYKFFITFIDEAGNETPVEEAENYWFTFDIFENYPLEVTPMKGEISNGYVGAKYILTSSVFTVSGDTTNTYKLEYSATENGEYKASDISFSSADLSFTPDKIGYYKVTCTAKSSTKASELEESNFIVVKVSESKTEVPAPSEFETWVSEHVVAVIFFIIGFICLVAIVILLFVKPKEN